MSMKNPLHPGDFIRTEIIEAAGLTVTAAAAALRVSRPRLSNLLSSKSDLSGDMALRIEKAFGVKMDRLMRMQSSYDIAETRKREKRIYVQRVPSLAAAHRTELAGQRFPSFRSWIAGVRCTVEFGGKNICSCSGFSFKLPGGDSVRTIYHIGSRDA
jgi:antitoxin HigA-1